MKNVEQVILYAHDEDLMLIGEVTGFGSPYNPRTWDEGSFYQCPKPWSKEPAKYWIALDNLRPLEGFNPDLYELAAGKDKGKPLSLVFEQGTHANHGRRRWQTQVRYHFPTFGAYPYSTT